MPQQQQMHVNGTKIAVYEWGQATDGRAPLLFAHASGFHARVWDQVIAQLPDKHCFALDMRGHGQSLQSEPVRDWRVFAADVAGVGEQLGLRGAIGVGHSLGGHAMTLATAMRPELFSQLLLIDPVIMPRERYVGVSERGQFAARRRNQWASADEMYARFKDRSPFNLWKPEVLRDYVDHALRPDASDEGLVLACTPDFEAATYNYGSAANIYAEIATVQIPVTILRAGEPKRGGDADFSASPTAPDLATQFPRATDIYLRDYTHFLPMQAPELVASIIRDMTQAS